MNSTEVRRAFVQSTGPIMGPPAWWMTKRWDIDGETPVYGNTHACSFVPGKGTPQAKSYRRKVSCDVSNTWTS